MGQDGHACMASAETSRNSFSVAPLAACTARPFSTVAVYRANDPVRQAAQDGETAGSRCLRASSLSIEKGPAPARISATRPAT